MLTLKKIVPANWIRVGIRSLPCDCAACRNAAEVKKSEPTKKIAASASAPTRSTTPGKGPTKKQNEPIAKSTPIQRVRRGSNPLAAQWIAIAKTTRARHQAGPRADVQLRRASPSALALGS